MAQAGSSGALTADPRPVRAEEQIAVVLAQLRAEINAHAGDLHLVKFDAETGEIRLRFQGACTTCHARGVTFATAILPLLSEIRGVTSVQVENLNVSEAAVDRIQSMLLPPDRRRAGRSQPSSVENI